jgi:hypothetical protein
MIIGLITIITLLVMRLQAPSVTFPNTITLPDGTKATAFTQTAEYFAIVTAENDILIYNRSTGQLVKRITLN